MGDIWPYGPPKYVAWDTVRANAAAVGLGSNDAAIAAAIGMAESSEDLTVINDSPNTGDYSVGIWQINYYGSLYASRVARFGTPRQLIRGGVQAQAEAMYRLWLDSGFHPWSTYNDGAYKQYLHGASPGGGGPSGQGGGPSPNTGIKPPTEDYSHTVKLGAESAHNLGITFANAATVLRKLRG